MKHTLTSTPAQNPILAPVHALLHRIASTILLVTVFLSVMPATPAWSHEGDHGAPGVVQAPKGGDIKAIEDAYIEVLSQKDGIKIYFYSHDMKPITNLKQFTVTAEAQLPRDKQMTPLALKESGGVLSTSFDPKRAHRFTLVLKVKDANHDHADRLNFTIETRR